MNGDTEILLKLQRTVEDVQRQGANNQQKLDRALRLLDGDDGSNIGLRAEMREVKRAVRDYEDHEKRIKALEANDTKQDGIRVGRGAVFTAAGIIVTIGLTMIGLLLNLWLSGPKGG